MDHHDRSSMDSFLKVLEFCMQGLEFFQLIVPYNITSLCQRLSHDRQQHAANMTFSGLVTSVPGFELIRELAKLTMQDIIQRNTQIDSICEAMSNKCPYYFQPNDIKISKALELIQKAQSQEADPNILVQQALRLLLDAAASVSASQLEMIAGYFDALGCPESMSNYVSQ